MLPPFFFEKKCQTSVASCPFLFPAGPFAFDLLCGPARGGDDRECDWDEAGFDLLGPACVPGSDVVGDTEISISLSGETARACGGLGADSECCCQCWEFPEVTKGLSSSGNSSIVTR